MEELQNIDPKKSLGQNFLNNPRVPMWMADAAELTRGETVLEIGPGTGMLTREFLARGAKVIAVEADTRAIEALSHSFKDELAEGQLVLTHRDIREIDFGNLALSCGTYKLIANIPYYLSGYLFRMFLEGDCQPKELVFLTQKEVAKRIARDKKESLLSLGVKAYGTPSYVKTISRGNFSPQPNVDSAIIRVSGISKKNFEKIEESSFFELLHLGFGSKRKQLLGNLTKKFDRPSISGALSTLNVREDVRAEDVPLATWLSLTKILSPQE